MESSKQSEPRDPWSVKGLVIGAWRSVLTLFVAENTLDRREIDKLHSRWEGEDATREAESPARPD